MNGIGTDEDMVIDVICSASNSKIIAIKEAFQEMTGKSLEDAIESECSGEFKRVLVAIIQGCRQKGCNEAQARIDAQELFEAGEDKIGTDESTFIRIMCNSSFKQIRLIDEYYQDITGHDLITVIEKELSGDFEKALKCIVQYAKNRLATVSDMLYESMKGTGTRDASLIRIILVYAETDLELIKGYFDQNYEQSLAEMIAGDISGDYKKFLLSIVQ
ncbi:unnamed protein product [Hymenolepis diminuta]|uniref:Annexin n=1 Tax=Hymenolepis diminuta TaxID=6216 RepID=A0A564Z128_HYMDI|nr:unnamed protein product [Hymenolepis diminuta]